MKKHTIIYLVVALIMIGLSVYFLMPNVKTQESVDYDKYYNMLAHLSAEERSIESPYHDEMRDYLVDQLRERGLEVTLLESTPDQIVRDERGEAVDYGVSNIYATLPANKPGLESKNIAFASHYDSVVGSYGAGDAGIAVISFFAGLDSILEKERVNNISILITDHEELGLVGASYIKDYHQDIYDSIDFIYNWESRGTGGNVILFETSENDYQGVSHYVESTSQHFAASFATAVYSRMPNGSDFTVFKAAGVPGLNFAMIEDFANYHTLEDRIENIPPGTFNTYINNVSQLMHAQATEPFTIEQSQRSIYFNYFDSSIVIGEWVVYGLMIATLLLLICSFILAYSRGTLRIGGFLMGILFIGLALGLAFLISMIPESIFSPFSEFKAYQPTGAKIRFNLIYNDVYAITSYLLLAIGLVGLGTLFAKVFKLTGTHLFLGLTTLLFIAQIAVSQILFGALAIITIPLLILQILFLIKKLLGVPLMEMLSPILLIPILYPVVYYIYIALTVNAILIYLLVAALFSLMMIPHMLPEKERKLHRGLPEERKL